MSGRDVYHSIAEQDEATLQRLVERLEFRGRDPTFVGYRDAYLQTMRLWGSPAILDLGCGTGVVGRALATDQRFGGTIVGVDQSPVLIEAARRLADQDGTSPGIEFTVGDVHALEFPDACFDVVIAHTLVSHVTDPVTVLAEAARVVRRDGLVAIFDGDYASLTFGSSDAAVGRSMEEALVTTAVTQPRVMRDLPRLVRKAGLRLVTAQAHLYSEVGSSRFFIGMAETYAPLIDSAGLLGQDVINTWLDEQRQAVEEETFFGACNYYGYVIAKEVS